mmetsp:Transcript_79528/g.170462  ORF Transcript_79528/g.170462 Transcript_79528/m.170462 type:complete len:725 (+) Transcript_79528:70-2244(+)
MNISRIQKRDGTLAIVRSSDARELQSLNGLDGEYGTGAKKKVMTITDSRCAAHFVGGELYGDTLRTVQVEVDGEIEEVLIDGELGLMEVQTAKGQLTRMDAFRRKKAGQNVEIVGDRAAWNVHVLDYAKALGVTTTNQGSNIKPWSHCGITEREVLVVRTGRWQHRLREKGLLVEGKARDEDSEDEGDNSEDELTPEEIETRLRNFVVDRCNAEMKKKTVVWTEIEVATVTSNENKVAKGMIYGMEFPWTENMVESYGPEWLTKALIVAGAIDEENKVKRLTMEKQKVTTGNNGCKFMFKVKYKFLKRGLHEKLFAKVPFPLEGVTRTDRLSSSVNKQPSELHEINASRLLESILPCKIPKYYYGDISNDTSNWILITECIAFGDKEKMNFGQPGPPKDQLEPYVIEGPYDKCADWNLRGNAEEYYPVMLRMGAKIAGMYKTGNLCNENVLRDNFTNMADKGYEFFPITLNNASGKMPKRVKQDVDKLIEFVGITEKLFPKYCQEEEFADRLKRLLVKVNGYAGEISFWKHKDQAYIAFSHPNMNVDNAFWWRDEDNELNCGILDWGGAGIFSLGHRLWWWLYCSEFEVFRDNIDIWIQVFCDSYEEYGGPKLDALRMKMMIFITAFEQLIGLCAAIPEMYKMCGKGTWQFIQTRYDMRIADNVNGKSSLRLYLFVIHKVIRIIEEMGGYDLMEQWEAEEWCKGFQLPAKTPEQLESSGDRMGN